MVDCLILLAALAAAQQPDATGHKHCSYDEQALVALDFVAFDQSGQTGWRPLFEAGCYPQAADAIAAWRAAREQAPPIVAFHEAQMRALADDIEAAIALLEEARNPDDTSGWDFYVDATSAFLRRDRQAIETAREELSRVPEPANWAAMKEQAAAASLDWPLNLHVVDGLISCWEAPYAVAWLCHGRDLPDANIRSNGGHDEG